MQLDFPVEFLQQLGYSKAELDMLLVDINNPSELVLQSVKS